jgi:5-methylcytosine-specific restriction endonuclease McrA
MIHRASHAVCRLPGIHHAICLLQGRSGKWPRVRKQHLKEHSACAVCGGKKDVEVHHVRPFHKSPKLELDPANLITLCNHLRCHLLIGHLGCFRSWNVDVRKMAALIFGKIVRRP